MNKKQELIDEQGGLCFLCQKEISLDDNLAIKKTGKERNIASSIIIHSKCFKYKSDPSFNISKYMFPLVEIKRNKKDEVNLDDILLKFRDVKRELSYSKQDKIFVFNNKSYKIHKDLLSGEESIFLNISIDYLYFDKKMNPRPLNKSLNKLIKEFSLTNPQLHLTLGRLEKNKIYIFDGQHKAVAQILLGVTNIPIRLFLNPKKERLVETNTNAGEKLKQIAFDKAILAEFSENLIQNKIKKYQEFHNLDENDFSFSELDLVNWFKGDGTNTKKEIFEGMKHIIIQKSKIKDYILYDSRKKDKPLIYNRLDVAFKDMFIQNILSENMDSEKYKRNLQIEQSIKLFDLIVKELYFDKYPVSLKFDKNIESKINLLEDNDIPDNFLRASRISKKHPFSYLFKKIMSVIKLDLLNKGIEETNYFQTKFDEELWIKIENVIFNYINLSIWIERDISRSLISSDDSLLWASLMKDGTDRNGVKFIEEELNPVIMSQKK